MNPIPMLRELLEKVPFEPFTLCLTDGRKLPVHHPDFLAVTPNNRIIWEGQTEDEFAIAIPLHVVGIERLPRRRRKRRAA